MANIIQAEFFLVSVCKPGQTLEGLMRQCAERQAEGMPIKAVVRFYDRDDRVTAQVQRYAELSSKHEELVSTFSKTKHKLWRWVLDVTVGDIACMRAKAKDMCLQRARKCLREAVRGAEPVAVETRSHHFRDLRDNEKHELLESVERSSSAWLFVFEPNDLLADSNKLVASAM